MSETPALPRYDAAGLRTVLPSVLHSLGVRAGESAAFDDLLELRPVPRAVVVLVDGLGYDLLAARGGHAPFLRGLLPSGRRLTAGFPSTTATSVASFGTGLVPGAHGLVGYRVLDPDRDLVFNELSWENGPDPRSWQPARTLFQAAQAAGLPATRIGPGYFDGSGLTESALRGGRFVAAGTLADRVDAAVAELRAHPRALVHLYWGDLDRIGHVHGCGSWQWGEELEGIDAGLRDLARRMPRDAALYITADHGMVDVQRERRIDLADDTELSRGIRHTGGEARARQLYCEPGAVDSVLQTWRDRLGEDAWVLARDEAVAAGWFGPVSPRVLPRIGDVIAAMRTDVAVDDSRSDRPEVVALLGVHGSVTPAEVAVPLLATYGDS